jgi:hypothetical protein
LLPAFAQVNKEHQCIRTGDEIIKQQVEYQSPGEAGVNKVWDFSRLKTINDEYRLVYSEPPLQGDSLYVMGDYTFLKKEVKQGELIIGTEHNTMYYYRQKGDSLLLLGHENPVVKLQYTEPVLQMLYPVGYGQHGQTKDYASEGLYSSTVPISSLGSVTLQADAFGKMVLPTGDTLNPVVRIKHLKTFNDEEGNPDKLLETYSWYTKGYRYPVFEAVRNINARDSMEIFSTAFFYPLQDHYYLSTDPENQALLDEMWDMENKQTTANTQSPANETQEIIEINKIYPNPVTTEFTVEYTLKQKEKVQIVLVSSEGNVVRNIQKNTQDTGFHQETITCSGLMYGIYHLKLIAGQQTINQTIIKN